MRQGKGTMQSITGEVYEGEFKKNLRHGRGAITYPDNTKYEGFVSAKYTRITINR